MFKIFNRFLKLTVFLSLLSVGNVMAESNNELLAKGDFFTIKQDEISLLRSRMKSFFETTEKEYCRALLKIKLFSKEAKDAKIDMEPEIAAELNQMVNQKLSELYISKILDSYKLPPGTVESYYDSHMEELVGKDGTPLPLDEKLNKKIRQNIMRIKRSEIANKEMARLIKKHNIEIINPVCADKDSSNE